MVCKDIARCANSEMARIEQSVTWIVLFNALSLAKFLA